MPLLNTADNVFLGSTAVTAIFLGEEFVWPPAVGSQPVISNVSNLGTLTVSWAATDFADSYQLRRNGTLITTTSARSYNDSGLSWNTSYSYKVTPVISGIPGTESSASVTINIPTPAGAKPTISNVSVLRTLTVSWAATPNASSYALRRNGTLIATTSARSYNDSNLSWNTNYSYTVTPTVGGKTGSSSAASSTVYISAPVGAKPSISNVSSAGTLLVSWAATSYATSYQVRRNGALIATTASRTYTDSGLAWNSSYSYTITPIVSGRAGSAGSATASGAIPVGRQGGLTPSSMTYTNVTVSWAAVAGATNYYIYVNGAYRASVSTLAYAIPTAQNTTLSVYVRPIRNGVGGVASATYKYYSGRAEQRDIGSKSGMTFNPSKVDSWRPADDWAWLSKTAAQGYYTSSYGNYKGVIYYGSSGVRDALRTSLGGDGTARQLNGSCTKCEVYLYKKTGVGSYGPLKTDIRRSNSTASGGEPSGAGAVTRTTAASGSGSWIDIGTAHGQALGDGSYKSLMLRKDGSTNYAQFTDCRLRLSWSWNYVTVPAAGYSWYI